jgi:hypothetical protein
MVSVKGFSVLPSNIGILEGGLDPETNARQREGIMTLARERYGDPVVAVEPVIVPLPEISSPRRVRERLPWLACIAYLTSAPLDPEQVASELTLVWWQDGFVEPLAKEIERAAAGVRWDLCAEDVDLW